MPNLSTILQVLPKIASHPLAILAYLCVLGAWIIIYFRRQRSEDFLRALGALPVDEQPAFARRSGYRYDELAALSQKQRLKLLTRRYVLVAYIITIIAIVFLAILAFAVYQQNYSGLKAAYNDLMQKSANADAVITRFRLRIEAVRASSDIAATFSNDPQLKQIGSELRQAADEFDSRYHSQLTPEMALEVRLVKALAANAEGKYQDAQNLVTDKDLETETIRTKTMLLIRADAACGLGQYQTALELYQRILALTPDSVLGLLGVTQCVMELGDYKEAVLIYSQLIEIAQSNSSPIKPLILAKAFNDRGVAYKRWKQYTNAITDFTESIKIGQKSDGNGLGLEDNLWVSFNNRGVTRGEAGQKLEALVDHNTALKLLSYPRSTDQSGLDFRTALLMNNRGYDYITLKRYSNALADINRAIAFWEASLARHPEFSNYLAMSLLNRGAVFNDIGLFTNAINDTDRTIEILDQLTKQEGPESKIQLAKAYSGRASAHESIGNLTAAVADYGQAIVICQTLASEGHSESAETLARGFQARAVVYGEAGQLQKAIADEDQAVQIFEYLFTHGRPDVIDDLAQALGNRGLSCSQLDQPIIALTNYNRAIELWHNFIEDGHPESTDELLSVLVNRCSTYLQINQITDATVDCDQAIALLESLTNNNPELTIDLAFDRVLAYGARGRARMFSGQETNAVADLTIAIDSLRGTKVNMPPQLIVALSTAYSDRALAYLRLGQPTNELQDVSTAINLLRPLASEGGQNISSKLGIQLFNQGISFNLVGQRTNAFQSYNLAIRQLQPLATNGPFLVNDVLGKAFMNRAVLYHQTGQLTNAMTGFTDAVETLTPLVKNHPEAEDDLGEAFMFRGLAYCGINQLTNALSDLHYSVQLLEDSFEKQQIASSRSDFGKSLAFLGFVLIYNHQTEEAKPYLEKSIALDVDSRITAVAKRALESKSTPEDLELRKIFSSKE